LLPGQVIALRALARAYLADQAASGTPVIGRRGQIEIAQIVLHYLEIPFYFSGFRVNSTTEFVIYRIHPVARTPTAATRTPPAPP